jgi:EAL domain-containing protein (putative c-di-GMP-specific phosphodiesterase class I)/ActR/RegA family two-component response regulator
MQTLLIVDDDAAIAHGLAALLERRGREILICSDLESAQAILAAGGVSQVVADVRLTGPFRFEGLDLVGSARRAGVPIVLMTGDTTSGLPDEAIRRGAAAVLAKPFEVGDIEPLIAIPAGDEEPRLVHVPHLDEIRSSMLTPLFQPIVNTVGGGVAGFEALTRAATDSPLANPAILFEYAALARRVPELELRCMRRALTDGAPLTRDAFLSFNIHPALFADATLPRVLLRAAADAGIDPRRIVVEITEQGALPDAAAVEAVVAPLHEAGVRLAFDDVGTAYSHTRVIGIVRPSLLKIDQHFGSKYGSADAETHVVDNVRDLARRFGAEVVLEGIETAAGARFAEAAAIRYAQGYYYGRPMPVDQALREVGS